MRYVFIRYVYYFANLDPVIEVSLEMERDRWINKLRKRKRGREIVMGKENERENNKAEYVLKITKNFHDL